VAGLYIAATAALALVWRLWGWQALLTVAALELTAGLVLERGEAVSFADASAATAARRKIS
jgi:hypothetical protein